MSLLVLASGSPRRIDFLKAAGVPHAVWPVDLDEAPHIGEGAEALVLRLSRQKADAAAERAGADRPVLGADTMVVVDGALLGKPPHEGAARQMIKLLAGRTHEVITGYHLRYPDASGALRRIERAVRTEVEVRPIAEHELEGYLASEEWRGKAGAYAIQGRFGCFVRGIRGSFDNVVGLPLCQVLEDLGAAGVLPAGWPAWRP
jgi:septum formation protein